MNDHAKKKMSNMKKSSINVTDGMTDHEIFTQKFTSNRE